MFQIFFLSEYNSSWELNLWFRINCSMSHGRTFREWMIYPANRNRQKQMEAQKEVMGEITHLTLLYRINFFWYNQNACHIIFFIMRGQQQTRTLWALSGKFSMTSTRMMTWCLCHGNLLLSQSQLTAGHLKTVYQTSTLRCNQNASQTHRQKIVNAHPWFWGCVTLLEMWSQNPLRTHWLSSTL